MSLGNYTELQAAIASELDINETDFVAAVPDLIKRAEVKLNRRTRLREAEQLAYATYSAGSRFLAVPTDYVELLNLRSKLATAADCTYIPVQYVDPMKLSDYYDETGDGCRQLYYTLRDQIEFNREVSEDHTIMMHFIKKWNIAVDSTNWLLTNYPDTYLYGALAESELFMRNDARVVVWKTLFNECIEELNELSERGRDDAVLDTSEISGLTRRSSFRVLRGY